MGYSGPLLIEYTRTSQGINTPLEYSISNVVHMHYNRNWPCLQAHAHQFFKVAR